MFARLAVVNRGEPAVRLIKAVRELNEEGGHGIVVVALHTEAERRALFVRLADEAVCLRATGTAGGPYTDHAELERALLAARADAAWVGWGFVAEDPGFAELCERLGVVFVGPPAHAMRRLGDKIEAKLLAEETGVPVAPWSGGPVADLDAAHAAAATVGYPLMIKARSGGGGRGIRMVTAPEELALALERTRAEAASTFGDDVVFLESLVSGGRHIEVQVMADAHGTVWAPGVRDCSVQRRNQKLVEESGSPVLDAEQEQGLREASVALVRAAGYRGAGTVEYLYQPRDRTFAFMEVNTRLQVEHPVTEATTGLDLVKLQLLVAAGQPLPSAAPPPELGHAVEVRLNAEDADAGFAPAPGTITVMAMPTGPGIRVDSGFAVGDVVPPDYDSMIAKVIAWGRDRDESFARLRCALRDMTVLLAGGTTTKSFLLELLGRPEVVSGEADTQWVDRTDGGRSGGPSPHADVALLAVAVDVYDEEEARERAAFLTSARGGRPRAGHAIGRDVELGYRGQTYVLVVHQVGAGRYRIEVGGAVVDLAVERRSAYERRLLLGGRRHRVTGVAGTGSHLVEVDGFSHRVVRDEAGLVRAPAPAVVVAVPVMAGDRVEAGDTLVVLESMKMETAVRASQAGTVRELLVDVNSQVDAGAPLLRLDRVDTDGEEVAGPAVPFSDTEVEASEGQAHALLSDLHALITGYDISRERGRALTTSYLTARGTGAQVEAGLRERETALLTTFADLCDLSRNRPAAGEDSDDEQVHSPREHLHTFLRTLDVAAEELPESFRARLLRALRPHGVTDLAPGPELEEAVYRVFLAQQRAGDHVPVVTALLERWRDDGEAGTTTRREEVGEVLDRLVAATQLRYPDVGDLTRTLRFQLFEQPVIRAAREESLAAVREQLAHLDRSPEAADRPEQVAAMVEQAEPVVRLLGARVLAGGSGAEPLLEVLTRRYYKIRALQEVRSFLHEGRQVVAGRYGLGGDVVDLLATTTDAAGLPAALQAMSALSQQMPAPQHAVVDLYVGLPDAPADSDELSALLMQALSAAPQLALGRRVTVTVFGRGGEQVRQQTFRDVGDGLVEDRVIRDMHPLTGQRLDLWRLKRFHGTRLPAPENTYLFHCVAKDNPADERLVALAEVRDVTPLRDASGRVTAFPAVERAFAACLDGIRRRQTGRDAKRLDANLVHLYVWPTFEVSLEELAGFAGAVAPLTVGAGLEEVMILGRLRDSPGAEPRDVALRFSYRAGTGVSVSVTPPPREPIAPVDAYTQQVRRSRARGATYPYEIVRIITGGEGTFTEHDLDDDGRLAPVDRPPGSNSAGIVTGVVSTPTPRYPEGMVRVALFGDPTRALGSVAEPECARVIAALDLAERMQVPVEWYALSSGAKISMDSGTENMDWVALALRRIITFTQDGGEINVVVAGINVGAQPYWNAEATMLMHTRGILVMTPDSAMVLTGKQSLDYSGGVSAEDNFGLGGYDRVMGPNGQAQYWAPDLTAACGVLMQHYGYTYVAPGEDAARPAVTADPVDRDVRDHPHTHPGSDFTTVGDIFSATANPERKKPFDIRTVIRAVVDADGDVLERWAGMAEADTSIVVDAYLGGHPVAVIGVESRPIPRRGSFPTDGPDQWTAGTLFPRSSKKTARGINAASGNRPLVVLANLSGFDGSPESLTNLQLEYGAEIGRAIVNFDGPIVFCVVSRYHGGAFVVFSGRLNDRMEVVAIEGSYASVIGGAPAAAVVFAREVTSRTASDPRVTTAERELAAAAEPQRAELRAEVARVRATVRSEKLGDVAAEFEAVHDIRRAQEVGSVHAIIPARTLRPYLVAAVERGLAGTALRSRPHPPTDDGDR